MDILKLLEQRYLQLALLVGAGDSKIDNNIKYNKVLEECRS